MHKIYVTLTLIAGFILALGLQQHRIDGLNLEISELKATLAKNSAEAAQAVIDKQVEIAAIKDQFYEQAQELQDQLDVVSNTRDSLIERLQSYNSATRTAKATENSKRGPSEQDQATFDLFIQLLDRHTRELAEVGEYADKLRFAGLMCENISDKWSQ